MKSDNQLPFNTRARNEIKKSLKFLRPKKAKPTNKRQLFIAVLLTNCYLVLICHTQAYNDFTSKDNGPTRTICTQTINHNKYSHQKRDWGIPEFSRRVIVERLQSRSPHRAHKNDIRQYTSPTKSRQKAAKKDKKATIVFDKWFSIGYVSVSTVSSQNSRYELVTVVVIVDNARLIICAISHRLRTKKFLLPFFGGRDDSRLLVHSVFFLVPTLLTATLFLFSPRTPIAV